MRAQTLLYLLCSWIFVLGSCSSDDENTNNKISNQNDTNINNNNQSIIDMRLKIIVPRGMMNVNSKANIAAIGGVPPYVFSIISGLGSIHPQTGVFVSGSWPGMTILQVTDASNDKQEGSVDIGATNLWMVAGTSIEFDPIYNRPVDYVFRSENGNDWERMSDLPSKRFSGAALVYHDKIWYLGGMMLDADGMIHSSSPVQGVFFTEDGVLWQSFDLENPLPKPMGYFGSVIYKDSIWIMGGISFDGKSQIMKDVHYTNNGYEWTRVGSGNTMPAEIYDFSSIVFDNKIWIVGGSDIGGNLQKNVYATVDGNEWNTIGALPKSLSGTALTVFNNKMWLVGGKDIEGQPIADVYSSSDGIEWNHMGNIPQITFGLAITVFQDKIWILGGSDEVGSQGNIWYSADGITWLDAESSMPYAIYGCSLVVFSD